MTGELMSCNSLKIELGSNQRRSIGRSIVPGVLFTGYQNTCRGGRTHFNDGCHEWTRFDMTSQDGVVLSKHSSIDSMSQAISNSFARVMQKGRYEIAISGIVEGNVDQVIHTSCHDAVCNLGLKRFSVEVRGSTLRRERAPNRKRLFRESGFAPIDPSLRPQKRSVEIVCATR